MKLAYELGKDEEEILNWQLDDYLRWLAFFDLMQERSGGKRGNQPRVNHVRNRS